MEEEQEDGRRDEVHQGKQRLRLKEEDNNKIKCNNHHNSNNHHLVNERG